ncbi:MAG TPA: sensor domain-containing diguanylate cyclase [Kineosporiaceae bacterium]
MPGNRVRLLNALGGWPGAGLLADGVMAGVLGSAVVLGAVLAVVPMPVATAMTVFWAAQPLLDVVMVGGCWRVTALAGPGDPGARFWRWLGRAGMLFAAGDSAETWTAVASPGASRIGGGTPHAVLIGSGILVMIGVTLSHPAELTGSQRRRMWMDAATVLAAAAAVIWYVNGGSTQPQSLAVAVVAMVSAFGLVKLTLCARPPFTRAATLLGVTGVASTGIANAVAPSGQYAAGHGVLLFLHLLPSVAVAVTPRVQELSLRREAPRPSPPRRAYSLLPYASVVVSQTLTVLTVLASDNPGTGARAWGVVAANAAVTILVVARQLDAFRENATLLRRLDASMLSLRRAEQRYRSLVQHSSDITLIISPEGTVTYASPALETVLGISPETAVGLPALALAALTGSKPGARTSADAAPPEWNTSTQQVQARHRDGSRRWLEVTFTNLIADPSVRGTVCNARNVTEARLLQDSLRHQASHDPLTQLANRSAFDEQVARVRETCEPAAVLMIDLDGFKPINDTYGHHAGDELLVSVAARIRASVRPGDLVARLGGDEFAVLLEGATEQQALSVAARITAALQAPLPAAGQLLAVSASVGVAAGPSRQLEQLLRDADAAMYSVKQGTGDGGYLSASTAQPPATA